MAFFSMELILSKRIYHLKVRLQSFLQLLLCQTWFALILVTSAL